ncbi:hypothetical protein FRC17_007411 [Serendipita sp. 399]|nr:hypothetical protein FRC17_007411 [Serendipita sp. 399]
MPRSTKSGQPTQERRLSAAPYRRSARLASAKGDTKTASTSTSAGSSKSDPRTSNIVQKTRQVRRDPKPAKSSKGKEPLTVTQEESASEQSKAGKNRARAEDHAINTLTSSDSLTAIPAIHSPFPGETSPERQPALSLTRTRPVPRKEHETRRTNKETEGMIAWLLTHGVSPSEEEIQQQADHTQRSASVRRVGEEVDRQESSRDWYPTTRVVKASIPVTEPLLSPAISHTIPPPAYHSWNGPHARPRTDSNAEENFNAPISEPNQLFGVYCTRQLNGLESKQGIGV